MPDDPNKEVERELLDGGKRVEEETEWGMGVVIILLVIMAVLILFGSQLFQ